MINSEVINLENVVVQEFIGPLMPNEIGKKVMEQPKTSILNFDSD